MNKWQDGWDYGRINFKVISVADAGDLLLFMNGKKVSTRAISTSDAGDTKYLTFPFSALKSSNIINIKGDSDDNTNVTISNIIFEVGYFDGEPNLSCTKTLSTGSVNVNDPVTVTLRFENIGKNVADEPRYDDSPLPEGISLISGSLNGDPGNLDPADIVTVNYIIKPTIPGNYIFGATPVLYGNLSSGNYQTTFNSVSLRVNGGNLSFSGALNKSLVELNEKITISGAVAESIGNSPITDAKVTCAVKNLRTGTTYAPFFLLFNTATQKYEGEFIQTDQPGDYEISVTTEYDYYTTANTVLTFKIPYIELSSGYLQTEPQSGTVSLTVDSNVSWNYVNNEEWINCSKTNEGSINISFNENTTGLPRTAVITIEGSGITKMFILEQKGNIATLTEIVEEPEIIVYPNPVEGLLKICFANQSPEEIHLSIINQMGEVVIKENIAGGIINMEYQLDLSNLEKGFYLLLIKYGAHVVVKKLIKN